VAQYECFVQETGYALEDDWKRYNKYGNHPVVAVSWEDAKAYCRWLAEKIAKPVELPSETQWEMAARGKDGRIYPWGNDTAEPNRLNFDQTGISQTSPVGVFPMGASFYGAMDMAGNAWEWVEDDWHESYKGAPNDGSAWIDDPRGSCRVFRGGGWNNAARYCRSAYRNRCVPGSRDFALGFRLVLLPGQ
jgi:formylglycine-generating enzyme required for sulfatase activity